MIEGIDGSGKDTQADLLVRHLGPKTLRVAEPDSDLPTGKLLRQMLRDGTFVEAHAALFLADRISLLTTKVRPALAEGRDVVSVRSWPSTLVYQQENWPLSWLKDIHRVLPCKATHLVLLDMDPKEALERTRRRPGPDEYYETLDVQRRIRDRYKEVIAEAGPFMAENGRTGIIPASGTPEEVHNHLLSWLTR